tara:strand:- start:1508 stop:2872 length:1365 start_codon:yes stop_codon:yes gene_type:complete
MLFRSLCLSLLLASSLFSATEIKQPTVNINSSAIKLQNSIYLDGNIVFFPLHEIKELKNLRSSRSPKNNGVLLYNNDLSVLFVQNSNEVWLNDSKHFMNRPMKRFHGKPFVDLSNFQFLFDLDYSYNKETQQLSFKTSVSPYAQSKNEYNSFKHARAGSTILDLKKMPKELFLAHQLHKINLLDKAFIKNKKLYINAMPILEQIGFSTSEKTSSFELSLQNFNYSIPKTSRFWQASHQNKSWTFMAAGPIVVSNNISYFEAESLFSFLDYSIYWNHFTSTIELLTNIHDFKFVEAENDYKISVISRYKLTTSHDNIHHKKDKYYSIIPYARVFGNLKYKWKDHSIIERISLKNMNLTFEQASHTPSDRYPNKAHVKISYRIKSPEYAGYFKSSDSSQEGSGLTVHLDSRLKGISVKENASSYKVKFNLTKNVTPKISRESKKIIIDFPDTVNEC